jgi:hypothetical protein
MLLCSGFAVAAVGRDRGLWGARPAGRLAPPAMDRDNIPSDTSFFRPG